MNYYEIASNSARVFNLIRNKVRSGNEDILKARDLIKEGSLTALKEKSSTIDKVSKVSEGSVWMALMALKYKQSKILNYLLTKFYGKTLRTASINLLFQEACDQGNVNDFPVISSFGLALRTYHKQELIDNAIEKDDTPILIAMLEIFDNIDEYDYAATRSLNRGRKKILSTVLKTYTSEIKSDELRARIKAEIDFVDVDFEALSIACPEAARKLLKIDKHTRSALRAANNKGDFKP